MTHKTLLLLPPPPEPATYATVKAAYHAPLLLALRESSNAGDGSVLDVALPIPQLSEPGATPGSTYDAVQAVVASFYKLVTIIAARNRINVEDASGVDVRGLLVSYPRNGKIDLSRDTSRDTKEGPVVELATLAHCHERWSTIYSIESEEGEQLFNNFVALGVPRNSIQKLRGGIVSVSRSPKAADATASATRHHYHPAVGGTFDHLHIGHKLLLTMTVFMVDYATPPQKRTVTVGITAEDLLTAKKFAEFLQDWHERCAATHAFIHSFMSFDPSNEHPEEATEIKNPGPNGHAVLVKYPSGLVIKYVEIWDPFGPTITEEDIDALIISAETRSGGKAVNDKRKEKSWKELDVYEVDVLNADEADEQGSGNAAPSDSVQQAFQNKLSSTEIRKKHANASQSRSKV